MSIVFAAPRIPVVLTFSGTGSIQQANIPAGISSIFIKMWGAGGGAGTWDATSDGGGGGYAQGYLTVSGPVTLDVYVGTGGIRGSSTRLGGWPNAGNGGLGSFSKGGGGGGFSAIFAEGDFTTPYIVAGGGGGGGGTNDAWPGGGLQDWYSPLTPQGQLGSQSAGGAGGIASGNQTAAGSPGSFLAGGDGAGTGSGHSGGGGGSGYYGGGGGSQGNGSGYGAQGGGGSSYIGHANLNSGLTYYNTDTGNYRFAANESDPQWASDVGRGGPGVSTNGNNGLVIISYISS